MLYLCLVLTRNGRQIYGKYGQCRPKVSSDDLNLVVSLVASSTSVFDSMLFVSTQELNQRNALKVAEMSVIKLFPDDFCKAVTTREREG